MVAGSPLEVSWSSLCPVLICDPVSLLVSKPLLAVFFQRGLHPFSSFGSLVSQFWLFPERNQPPLNPLSGLFNHTVPVGHFSLNPLAAFLTSPLGDLLFHTFCCWRAPFGPFQAPFFFFFYPILFFPCTKGKLFMVSFNQVFSKRFCQCVFFPLPTAWRAQTFPVGLVSPTAKPISTGSFCPSTGDPKVSFSTTPTPLPLQRAHRCPPIDLSPVCKEIYHLFDPPIISLLECSIRFLFRPHSSPPLTRLTNLANLLKK